MGANPVMVNDPSAAAAGACNPNGVNECIVIVDTWCTRVVWGRRFGSAKRPNDANEIAVITCIIPAGVLRIGASSGASETK